jgi:hypothetical protein
VLVLAVEPSKEPDHLLITLAVTLEQSEKLFHALTYGPLAVIWRKGGDFKIEKTEGATSPFGRVNTPKEE